MTAGSKARVEEVVRDFLNSERPTLDPTSCVSTKGHCDSVSSDLHHYLKDHGIESTLVEGRGLIPPLGDKAHPEWLDFVARNPEDRRFLSHVVVLVGTKVVDLTGAQFGLYTGVLIEPLSSFKRRWRKVVPFSPWQRTAAQRFYWFTPRRDVALPPGTAIHQHEMYDTLNFQRVEKAFEQVRAAEFPSRPPRVGSSFVCPSLAAVERWIKGMPWRVFEVRVEGQVHYADAALYNQALEIRDPESVAQFARLYWKGTRNGRLPEVVAAGRVTIIQELDPFRKRFASTTTKDGRRITFRVQENRPYPKLTKLGFRQITFWVDVDGDPAGELEMGFWDPKRFDKEFPSADVFAVKYPRLIGQEAGDEDIWRKKYVNMRRDVGLARPSWAEVQEEFQRQGVASALYLFAKQWLARRGVRFYASHSQTFDSTRMWDRFDSRGLVDMDEHGRYLKARRLAVRYLQAAAARYKDKKTVKTQDGDEMTVYEYSDRQIANRNRQKAERVEKLRKTIKDLRKQVQKDLKSEDEHTRMVALAVGLMDATYERVGNDESAKEGHFGVTGWKVKHLTLGKDKATIKYVGKSGVKHEKVIDSPGSLTALREAVKGKKDNDEICGGVKAEDVNAYLKPFDVTAKDIRGYHANTEMQTRLKAVRGKGGKLPEDKKEREKKLKEEFKKALEETAEAVGHEPATLKSQYLVPGLEDDFLKDGTVDAKLDKRGSTPKLLVERNNLRVTVEPDNGQFTTHSSAYVFLANTKEDANAGYLILVPSPRDGGYWYVGNVYVDPLFRRQGLSKLLHDTAYAWATRYGGSFRSGMITSPENRSYWEKLEQAGKAESYDAGPGDIQYKRTKTSNHSGDPELNAWVEEYLRRHPKVRPFLRDRVWHVTHPGAGNHPEARYTSRGIEIYPKFWNLAEDPRDFVFTHEVGHSVLDRWGLRQFIAAAEAAGVDVWDTAQLPFSNGNMHEAFADSFASYFLDGDVRHRYPVWVPLVEEGMKRGKTASVSAAAVRSFGEQVEQDLGLESFDLYLTQQGDIQLNLLVVGKAARKQGVGTEAMSLLCRFADQQGARVVLSPALRDDRKGTTSRSRLVQFYKRFGFVENKGRHVDFSLSAGMYRNPALRREANTWPPGVFLHGTSERFDRFRPGRHHAIYLSQPKGRKTQAEYISEGPRGGWLAEVAVDFQKGKIFNPYQDPLAEEIRLRVMGSNPDPTDKRIPYEEAPDIIREASPYGYTIFRFYERSVRDESIAVMDLSLLKILRWHKVDR